MATVNMDRLLQACVAQGASDIHIVTNRPPVLRIDGQLRALETKVLEPDDTVALMKSITPEKNQQEIQERGGTDFGFAFGDVARFRVSVFRQRSNITMILRLIPTRGLFLVTGPTGSGKTTTLAAMTNFVNENLNRHIITIEEPIEYYHKHKKSIVNQREVGVDVPSFAEALRRILRQDPDLIVVGELRDLETIGAALRAAETGHLVFGTLHTTSAAGTISRVIDAFPPDQQSQIRSQLASNLMAVLSQVLCPLASGKGRIAAYEFMVVTSAIANLIREDKTYRIDSSIQTGKKLGMQLLDEHLWLLYSEGKITVEEMLEKSRQPAQIREKLAAKAGKMQARSAADEEDEEEILL
jgi:twitching motility protein PilT